MTTIILPFEKEIEHATLVEFSIRNIPKTSIDLISELCTLLKCINEEEMMFFARTQYQYLNMNPVAPIALEPTCEILHAGEVASLYVLARCSERLFMKRRKPIFTHSRLRRKIYIHQSHIGVLAKRTRKKNE
jgi:hypothetical protein